MTFWTFLLSFTLLSSVHSLFLTGPRVCRIRCELYVLSNIEDFIKDEFISGTGIEFRAIENENNNLQNPSWGGPHDPLLRRDNTLFAYADGVSEPSGADRPNERNISNTVFAQQGEVLSTRSLSNLVWQFGQFVDHDLTFVEETHEEPISVQIPEDENDPFFNATAPVFIRTFRAEAEEGVTPRTQFNIETAYLDGSQVYGSTKERADALRTFQGGFLKVNDQFTDGRFDHLPFNEDEIPNGGGTFSDLLIAGDQRVNEQTGLIAMHTLFVREHNRLASFIGLLNPFYSDDKVYELARAINIAVMQHITMNEFFEAVTGRSIRSIPETRDLYDETVSVQMTASFATFGFRVGHTMLRDILPRQDKNLDPVLPELRLRDSFFQPETVLNDGIADILRGFANTLQSKIDSLVVDGVRNFLFESADEGTFTLPLDLVTLNLIRGRDFGLPDYNTVRLAFGLEANTLEDITSDPDVLAKLKSLYGDESDKIDPFVGALAEDPLEDSSLGELLNVVWEEQFRRLRVGDRFYYTRYFKGELLEYIQSMTLKKLIILNSQVKSHEIPSENAFFVEE